MMPARSKSGLGIEAATRTVMNAFLFSHFIMVAFILSMKPGCLSKTSASSISLNTAAHSSVFYPAIDAARAMKYGGNSPIAVPAPQRNASKITSLYSWKKVMVACPEIVVTHGAK